MDIAHQFKQVGVAVAEDRLVAALKQVADLAVAAVEYLGVASLDPLHDLGQSNALGLDQDVDVVGHQDISMEPKAVALAIVLDALEVALAVVIVVEGLLALVAAHDDVVEGAVKLDSGLSRHAGTVSVEKTECQINQYSGPNA